MTTQVVTCHTGYTITGMVIDPHPTTVTIGGSHTYTATGSWNNGPARDITSLCTWVSSDASLATFTSPGNLTVVDDINKVGLTCNLTATAGGFTSTIDVLTAGPKTLTLAAISDQTGSSKNNVTIDLPVTLVAGGGTLGYTYSITGSHAGTTITTTVSGNVITIHATPSTTYSSQHTTMTATVTDSKGVTATRTFDIILTSGVSNPSSIALTPVSNNLAYPGDTQQFTATLTYDDGWSNPALTNNNVTNNCTWTSDSVGVVMSGTTKGLATAAGLNSVIYCTITATYSGVPAATITCYNGSYYIANMVVTPADPSVNTIGGTQQFTATAICSGEPNSVITSLCSWTSSNTGVATINSSGLATVIGYGTTTITTIYNTLTQTTTLYCTAQVVSISISPSPATLGSYLSTQQFTVTGILAGGGSAGDVTGLCTWSSASSGVVSVTNAGLATAVALNPSATDVVLTATNSGIPPTILTQPVSDSFGLTPGEASCSVQATGTIPLTYRWYNSVAGTPLADSSIYYGTGNATLILSVTSNITTSVNTYCIISNSAGSVQTNTVMLKLWKSEIVCPAAYTLIDTVVGPKRADELRVGDMLPTYDEKSLDYGEFPIIELYLNRKPIWRLETEDGRILDYSEEHPFYSMTRGWTALNELEIGEELFGTIIAKVKSVTKVSDEDDVVGMAVGKAHTMQSAGILSHNQSSAGVAPPGGTIAP